MWSHNTIFPSELPLNLPFRREFDRHRIVWTHKLGLSNVDWKHRFGIGWRSISIQQSDKIHIIRTVKEIKSRIVWRLGHSINLSIGGRIVWNGVKWYRDAVQFTVKSCSSNCYIKSDQSLLSVVSEKRGRTISALLKYIYVVRI